MVAVVLFFVIWGAITLYTSATMGLGNGFVGYVTGALIGGLVGAIASAFMVLFLVIIWAALTAFLGL